MGTEGNVCPVGTARRASDPKWEVLRAAEAVAPAATIKLNPQSLQVNSYCPALPGGHGGKRASYGRLGEAQSDPQWEALRVAGAAAPAATIKLNPLPRSGKRARGGA
jgi:hypothetical protein